MTTDEREAALRELWMIAQAHGPDSREVGLHLDANWDDREYRAGSVKLRSILRQMNETKEE